jgi:hypothetical protein
LFRARARATVEAMQSNALHRRVESDFRELIDDAGLDAPDRVEYVPGSVVFYWDGPRLAVFVDFEGDGPAPDDGLADLLVRGPWPVTG